MSDSTRARWPPSDDRVAASLAASAVFLLAWSLVHTWFWGHGALVDWPTYESYGDLIKAGGVPYRDFAVEYPPGSLPVFVLPELLGGVYAATFAWTMAVCGVVLVWVVAALDTRAAFYVALAPVLSGSLILSRFDLWPALLATGALVSLVRGRQRLGWVLLGAAVAAKLWPLVLVPPALVWSARRGQARSAGYGVAVLAVVFVPFLVLAPHGLAESVVGQASRPLQVESLGAALLTTFGQPHIVNSHGSQNVAGYRAVGVVFALLAAAALGALWLAFARGPVTEERFIRYAAACICAFVAFGKVLSPQYLLWLIPVVPLVRGRRGGAATLLLTLALVLTQVWFPWRYFAYALRFHLAGVVLLRDLVLVILLAVLALPFPLARSERDSRLVHGRQSGRRRRQRHTSVAG